MKAKPAEAEKMRMYKIIFLVVLVLLLIPLLTHYYLNKVAVDENFSSEQDMNSHPWIVQLADVDKLKGAELKFRIEELLRIKFSVTSELRDLEAKRQHVQSEIALLNRRLEEAKMEAGKRRNELDRLQISLQQAKVAEKEAMERNTPRLGRPKPVAPLRNIPSYPLVTDSSISSSTVFIQQCQMDACFDYSLCPMSSRFQFYAYSLSTYLNLTRASAAAADSQPFILNTSDNSIPSFYSVLDSSPYSTRDYLKSCLFILIVDDCEYAKGAQFFKSIPHWFGDGRNHVILFSCKNPNSYKEILHKDYLKFYGRAMIASETAFRDSFRPKFDVVISHWKKSLPAGEVWTHLPAIVPAKRKYLATYLGMQDLDIPILHVINIGGETDHYVQSELLKIQQDDPQSFVFQFSCNIPQYQGKRQTHSEENELKSKGGYDNHGRSSDGSANGRLSSLCENDLLRTRLLVDSTFSLIILPPEDFMIVSSDILQFRLYESLKYGAIPIVIGNRFEPPFAEVIDWSKIILTLPSARITEIHYLLKSFTDEDLLALRRNGRLTFENYLSTMERMSETLLAVLRTRIGIPPNPYKDYPSPSVFNESFTPLKLDTFTVDPEEEENLGPIEPPYPSLAFARNYSSVFLQKYEFWNTFYQPFKLYPYTPWDLTMPSEAKFRGSALGFRPIAGGAGGSGKEFSQSIGGNTPKEQFTIVMLTYEREQVLMNSLQRLFGLPYLNKVVVVWNSPQSPLPDLRWPDIGVPIHVVKAKKNSLNNRFVPYDAIETEALLSIDDDAHLRHDEIVFGFRVWRENRDRIVGFPGRYHAWDQNFGGWHYNSNYSCELSMVLTGAAFYHKVYSYLYTYDMPSAIRDKVDELMNCEDIAMNFLVSHLTQKPPVKVTSRWTFRCPGCPVTLSEDDSHFQERHHCINFFSQVYGYTPLLYTQFRADSILFKTRIPHDKQKCFKYI